MKTILTLQKFFFLLAAAAVGCIACKKTDTVTLTIQQPTAEFSVLVSDPFSGFQMEGTTNYIDSSFYFRNSSDSGSDISYTWDFGMVPLRQKKPPSIVIAREEAIRLSSSLPIKIKRLIPHNKMYL